MQKTSPKRLDSAQTDSNKLIIIIVIIITHTHIHTLANKCISFVGEN